ncbi:hypothetical protein E2C01_050074 [Portunus trituberculatus]|uniref:Uncharacterized protein n=1 Tax=Portunus trituberculatus TaxID=210409 RepID=A0A5B7G806_PORTR|nr:hypothetical protein [Portunus trituberculatus]
MSEKETICYDQKGREKLYRAGRRTSNELRESEAGDLVPPASPQPKRYFIAWPALAFSMIARPQLFPVHRDRLVSG